tara:strand:+ start:520 stop:1572 length:1053 start_codon:yes stop_codon:yes gene_type:complete
MRLISLIVLFILVGCKKDKPIEPVVESDLSNGIAVLCEGLFQQNNSSVSWVNLSNGAVTNSFFESRANRLLGDTGNDIQRYGGKVYIVVNVSSTIEVLDANTFYPIKQISMLNNGVGKQPRSITFANGKAFVTCYDGFLDVIDTSSLSVEQRIPVGLNPESVAVANGKIYVSNSGGLNAPLMDSTVSVLDLNTYAELTRITVGLNPGQLVVDNEGDIYSIIRGDFGAVSSSLTRIDTQIDVVADQFSINASSITKMNNKLLIGNYDFTTQINSVLLFDALSETIENSNYLNLSEITTLYGIQYNPVNDLIYTTDAMSFTNTGFLRVFSTSGNLIQSYHLGLNPVKVIFYD